MSGCKCTGGDSSGGIRLVRGHQFFSENMSSLFIDTGIRKVEENMHFMQISNEIFPLSVTR